MPKRKSSPRASKKKSPPTSPPSRKPNAPAKATAPRQNYTEEYTDYLERYELYGEGRPRLSPAEFDRLDEEMLDLLAQESEQGVLTDDQIVRLQELEFLLLDSDQ
jgi:hypothetical protein